MDIEEHFFLLIIQELDATISDQSKQELDLWVSSSSKNRKAYAAIKKLYHQSSSVYYLSKFDRDQDWSLIQKKIYRLKKRKVKKTRWLMAASIVIVVSLGLYYSKLPRPLFYDKLEVSQSVKSYYLPDSTLVTLNVASKLFLSKKYGLENRALILEGEAFFDVKKNPSKPFVINSGKTKTTVLGTKFNILTNKKGSFLTVTEGVVAFEAGDQSIVLNAREAASFNAESLVLNRSKINQNTIGWVTGKLEFKNTPIGEVFYHLEKTYHVSFHMANLENSALRLTTSIDNESLSDVLQELETVLPIRIRLKESHYVVSPN